MNFAQVNIFIFEQYKCTKHIENHDVLLLNFVVCLRSDFTINHKKYFTKYMILIFKNLKK